MSACRSVVHQPSAPLVDMVDHVMPIVTSPRLGKKELIDQLVDYVRSSGLLVDGRLMLAIPPAADRMLQGLARLRAGLEMMQNAVNQFNGITVIAF